MRKIDAVSPPLAPLAIRPRAVARRGRTNAGVKAPLRALAGSLALALPPAALALGVVEAPSGSIRPGDPIVLKLDRAPTPSDGALVVFIGPTDVTSLFRLAGSELSLTGKEFALAAGELPLVVWRVQGGQWQEIDRRTLTIVAEQPAADAPAEAPARRLLAPTLDLAVKAQSVERTRGSASRPPRPTFSDLALRGGVAVDGELGGLGVKGNANFSGSSFRQEALQFLSRGTQAAKVDLADYRFDVGDPAAQLSVGHIGWGNHPLLLNSYGSRGLIGAVKLGQRFDVSVNAMNGTSIVGFQNPLGLNDGSHRIYGAAVGIEADPSQAGWLRGELSYVDASLRAQGNFNRGEIPDAEQSRGFGLRLLGRMMGGRLRSDIALARNEYRPADDPQLSQGQSLTPLQATTRSARIVDLAFDLLQAWSLGEGWPLTVTPLLRYERIAPLYRMVGAAIGADQQLRRAGLTAQLGPLQANLSRTRREDNLDNIASLLKTRTDSDEFTLSVPLAEALRAASAADSLWPRLSLQWQDQRQFAVNAPSFDASGLLPTHRPDQANRTATLALAWTLGRWALNYAANQAHQDNRQAGREAADFRNTGHQLSLNVVWSDTLSLNASAQRNRQYSYEKALAGYTWGGAFGFDWRFADVWTLGGNYALTRGDDSRDLAVSRGNTVQTQLGRRFSVPGPFATPLAGQWFVRHALQGFANRDNSVGLNSGGRNWALSLGANVTVF